MNNKFMKYLEQQNKIILCIKLVLILAIATVAILFFTGVIDIEEASEDEDEVELVDEYDYDYDFSPYTEKPLMLSRDSEIIMINGVECNLSMTCSEFCEKTGIKFANEAGDINTETLEGNDLEFFSFANEFGKTNSIILENRNSEDTNLANCILKGFSYEYSDYYENPTTFDWNGITQNSTYDEVLTVLGAPSDDDYCNFGSDGDLQLTYHDNKSRGHISVEIDKDKKIKAFSIQFSRNFDFGSYTDKPLKISKDSEEIKINGAKCNLSMSCSEFSKRTGIKFKDEDDINTVTLSPSETCVLTFADEFCGKNMINIQQQNSEETKIADCKVIGFFYDDSTGYENPVTFEWNGITQDSTLDDALKALGAPGEDDYYYYTSSGGDNNLELIYISENDGEVCICFDDVDKKLTEFSINCY